MTVGTAPFPPIPPVGHVTTMRAAYPLFVGLFVEGPDDVEMWNRWLTYQPLDCDGCSGVRRAIEDIRRRGLKGCVGIVDADLERITGALVHDPDVVVSEKHDHECDLICSPALESLLESLPHAASDLRAMAAPHSNLCDAIRVRALPFGLLRWIFHARRQEFPARLTPNNQEMIDRNTWHLDRETLLAVAANMLAISRPALDAEIALCIAQNHDEWQICNGHDVVALLRIAFSIAPAAGERCRSEKSVGWALRSAVDSAHLQAMSMWQQLGHWDVRNSPFKARRV